MNIVLQIIIAFVFGMLLKLTTDAPTWACVSFAITWALVIELIGIMNRIYNWLLEDETGEY